MQNELKGAGAVRGTAALRERVLGRAMRLLGGICVHTSPLTLQEVFELAPKRRIGFHVPNDK